LDADAEENPNGIKTIQPGIATQELPQVLNPRFPTTLRIVVVGAAKKGRFYRSEQKSQTSKT
jgi:hypothetical protein